MCGSTTHWFPNPASLEKEMATHSSILAWKIPWAEEAGGLQSTGSKKVSTTERLSLHTLHVRYTQCMQKTLPSGL